MDLNTLITESLLVNGRYYATTNSTIAFVYNGQFYVTPYRREAMETLISEAFQEASFYTPFNNGDHPKEDEERWEELLEMAQESYIKQHAKECSSWHDEHNIGVIANIENRCFKMPDRRGLLVKYPQGYEDYHFAMCSCMGSRGEQYLGKFCMHNGIVAFIYRDGGTYLAKGYRIINELVAAGYIASDFTVPLSNGEIIIDDALRASWDRLEKDQI